MPGTLADVDSEFLHDLRVAVRRSRALQRELRGVFPPEPLRVFRDGFRELQVLTGPTRDLDVQLLEFGELAAGLGDSAAARRRAAAAAARAAPRRRAQDDGRAGCARSARARCWRTGRDFLDELVDAPEDDRPDAARPIADVAAERIGTGLPADGEDGPRDRRRQPARGAARPAQEGQGAALPARVLLVAVSAGGRQADGRDAEGAAGRARALPGPRGAGRPAARAGRRHRGDGGRRGGADGDGRARRAARRAAGAGAGASSPRASREFAAKPQRKIVARTFG